MMIPLLSIAVIGTVCFGRRDSAAQTEGMDADQVAVSKADDTAEESTVAVDNEGEEASESSVNRSLDYYESNAENLSFYEYLDYVSLKKDSVNLALYGDIDTDAAWVNDITESMSGSVSGDFMLTDHSYPGYDSYELYIEQTAQAVREEKPDVLIYALPAVPDKIRDIGLQETEEFMGYVLDRLNTLEDTKIVLLEPYPVPGEIGQLNSRSLDYRSYLNRMREVSDEYGMTLIPLHAALTDDSSGDSLADYYDEAGEMNETGTQQVVTVLDALLTEEM